MDPNQRPHSREKTTGSGSAGVGKGRQVNTGSRPVGAGGRSGGKPSGGRGVFPPTGGQSGGRPTSGGFPFGMPSGGQQQSQQRAPGIRLNLKTILILVVLVIIAVVVLKSCAGGILSEGDYNDPGYSNISDINTPSADPVKPADEPDNTVSSLARDKRVVPLGGGRDTVTIMIYMCGTDLESKYGMATSDLQEMLKATISDKVNVIVETGGCRQWKNNVVSSDVNQIYKVESGGLKLLEKNVGTAAMTDPDNLTDFITYCTKNYPADRNALIFWDHGGGSLTGYGYDEKHSGASSMTLSKIDNALRAADCVFDWIGFDACLMATLETALVCNEYADYMIASEETEPGTGWHYTGWLTALSKNTSISTVELSREIIDDFVSASTASSPSAQVTLSVIDLAELQGTVPDAFRGFASSTNELLQSDDYQLVSDARAGVRQFAKSNKLNQVDLVDLALRIGTDEAEDLAKALQGCVKYNKSTMSRCYGVSIFFPYETTNSVSSAVASYKDLGIDSEYAKCIQSFASLEYGGQIAASASHSPADIGGGDLLGSLLSAYAGSGSSSSPLTSLLGGFTGSGSSAGAGYSIDPAMIASLLGAFSGRSMPTGYDWVDTDLIAAKAEDFAANYIDPARITTTKKDGHDVLVLTDDEWSLIQTVELNVFVPDGDGFIDLGLDNTFEWYGDDLLLEHDGTWLTLNGNVCAYYLVSDTEQDDGTWTTVGRIPALLNGEFVNLQVVFDADHPQGTVTGAYPLYDNGETAVLPKGDIEVLPGDSIELLCDYYDLDGGYSASYTLGTEFTVPDEGLELYNLTLDADELSVTWRLTDIYGNHYWTPVTD